MHSLHEYLVYFSSSSFYLTEKSWNHLYVRSGPRQPAKEKFQVNRSGAGHPFVHFFNRNLLLHKGPGLSGRSLSLPAAENFVHLFLQFFQARSFFSDIFFSSKSCLCRWFLLSLIAQPPLRQDKASANFWWSSLMQGSVAQSHLQSTLGSCGQMTHEFVCLLPSRHSLGVE